MNTLDLVVETRRLTLLPITRDFCEPIFQEFTKEITRYMFPQWTGDIVDTERFINESLSKMQGC